MHCFSIVGMAYQSQNVNNGIPMIELLDLYSDLTMEEEIFLNIIAKMVGLEPVESRYPQNPLRAFWLEAIIFAVSVPPLNYRHD